MADVRRIYDATVVPRRITLGRGHRQRRTHPGFICRGAVRRLPVDIQLRDAAGPRVTETAIDRAVDLSPEARPDRPDAGDVRHLQRDALLQFDDGDRPGSGT